MQEKRKLLVICGPTATGKTAFALRLAEKFAGEIVSADSRQVYKGMDIGTGKDLPVNSKLKIQNEKLQSKIKKEINKNFNVGVYELDKIPVWLLDVVEPDYQFTVADYVKCANLVTEDIWQRGKLPILVGGTGLYIKAITDGIETLGVPPDWELRKKLSPCSIAQLLDNLKKVNHRKWVEMNESDRNNPRRLIRAIEIAQFKSTSEVGGTPPEARGDTSEVKGRNILLIGLTAPYKILYQRIDQRVEERVKQGIEKEIESLLARGYSWGDSALGTTIGYRQWRDYFEKKTTPEEVVQRWKFAEHSYTRRQLTWFKKDKRISWFDITCPDFREELEKQVRKWYNQT